MKRKFFAFIALITATLSLSSCLSSDDDLNVEYTHDTAITAFSLGTLDQWGKTKDGTKDSLYKAVVAGANYKFYIDQATRQIYNVDSLPCGVRDTAILATISSKNSSPILLMDINKTDSVAAYYSSSDSINFSKPRFIRVYSSDYSAYAQYQVTVNVHKELPYEFKWHELAQNNSQLAAFSDLKAVACGDDIYVFGKTAEGTKVLKSAINDGSAWSSITMNVGLSSDAYQSAVVLDGKLYISDAGKVYASADAERWAEVSENADIKQLIGASSKYLYAYTAAGISVSKDKGVSWEQEKLDTDADYLPKQNISMNVAGVLSAKDVENVMLLGTRDKALKDTVATTWLRTVDYANEDGQWNYLEIENNKSGKMPWLDQVITCAADTGFVALGSNGKWYKSQDAGLTWTQDKKVALPDEFGTGTAARFAFCRDKQHYYWIIRNGYVWRGRFNIDGWSKED